MKILKTLMMAIMVLAVTSMAFAMDGHNHNEQNISIQETCPVMGGKINKKLYADVKGKRIYVCCPACIGQIKANPDKYIKEFADKGISLEDIQK